MANKENIGERGIRFSRNLHIAIGAVALAGAVVFPQIEALSVIAGYGIISALGHEGVIRALEDRRKRQPKPA